MKKKFPGVLWLLPIFFGLFGGVIAGLIASLKYQASWWELVAGGLLINLIVYAGVFLIPAMVLL